MTETPIFLSDEEQRQRIALAEVRRKATVVVETSRAQDEALRLAQAELDDAIADAVRRGCPLRDIASHSQCLTSASALARRFRHDPPQES